MYTVRKARQEDTQTVVEARLELLRTTRDHGFQFPSDFKRTTEEYISRRSEDGSIHSWVAEDQRGNWIGVVSLLLWSRPPLPEDGRSVDACIVNAYVKPAFQRKGIGTRLLNECLTAAGEFEIGRFYLSTTEEGLPLYISRGFTTHDSWMEYQVD